MKIDDLLDLLTNKASAEVAKRNPEFSAEECQRVGAQIAVAAIRYFMLKYSRGKLIVFDIEEALSFEGETGPYLQYAVGPREQYLPQAARARGADRSRRPRQRSTARAADELTDAASELWALVLEAARLDEIVEQVVRSLEFSVAGEIRLRPRAAVQRVLPSVPDPQRGADRPETLARGRASRTSGRS